MSHSGNSGVGPPSGDHGRNHYHQYGSGSYPSGDGSNRQHARSPGVEQQYYAPRQGERDSHEARRTHSGKYPEDYRRSHSDKDRQGSRHSQSHRQSDSRSAHQSHHQQPQQQQQQQQQPYAPTTGQMRSGHLELDSLYSGDSGPVQVNSMNAPNNSTVQCGCENIDCPFCNLTLSIQMGAK